jgi:hypothetical protein
MLKESHIRRNKIITFQLLSCVALIYWLFLSYKGETMEEPHNFIWSHNVFLGECSPCVVALKFTKKVNFEGTSLGKKGLTQILYFIWKAH